MELLQELTTRMEDASKDTVWAEKLSTAADWDTCAALLGEKGIEPPAELKAAFAANHTGKTGKLEDVELEQVSGGVYLSIFCKQYYSLLCHLTACPHLVRTNNTPDADHYEMCCTLHGWCAICENRKDNDLNKGAQWA